MKKPRKNWGLAAYAGLLLATLAGVVTSALYSWRAEAVTLVDESPPVSGPIRCKPEILSGPQRLAAVQRVNTWTRRALERLAPPVNNPLVMNEAYVMARVENASPEPVTAFQALGGLTEAGSFGFVRTTAEDEQGRLVAFGRLERESLKHIGLIHAGRQTVTLHPGQVVWYPFRLLGRTDLDQDVRPSTYTIRPVFCYLGAPDGTMREVPMQPLKVRINRKDIEEWRFWVA